MQHLLIGGHAHGCRGFNHALYIRVRDLFVFDRYHAEWGETECAWFEALLEEEDVDIMGWALGTLDVPEEYRGPLMDAFRKLDYVEIPH